MNAYLANGLHYFGIQMTTSMFDDDNSQHPEIARQITGIKDMGSEIWLNEEISIVESANTKRKEQIKTECSVSYQNKYSEILHNIIVKFSDLMKKHEFVVKQFAKKTPEINQMLLELIEIADRHKPTKSSRSKGGIRQSLFDLDFKDIINSLAETGEDINDVTVFSNGSLFHNGEFYHPNEQIMFKNRICYNQPGSISLITQSDLVIEQDDEDLILSLDDLTSNRYQISH